MNGGKKMKANYIEFKKGNETYSSRPLINDCGTNYFKVWFKDLKGNDTNWTVKVTMDWWKTDED